MKKEQVITHIIKAVGDSQAVNPQNKEETEKEIVNQVYNTVKPNASVAARSAFRRKVIAGDFGENFILMLELLNQCGLDIKIKD